MDENAFWTRFFKNELNRQVSLVALFVAAGVLGISSAAQCLERSVKPSNSCLLLPGCSTRALMSCMFQLPGVLNLLVTGLLG